MTNALQKQQNQQEWAYFSDTLPVTLAKTVRTIGSDADIFTTARLSFDTPDDNIKTDVILTAQKDDQRNDWQIKKKTRTLIKGGEKDDTTVKIETVLSHACFFDALHYCAQFEQSEKAPGAQVMPQQNNTSHYRTVGENAGQPFDSDTGLPVPTANRRLLLDGVFSYDPEEIINKGKTVSEAITFDPVNDLEEQNTLPAKNETAALAMNNRAQTRQQLLKTYEKAEEAVAKTYDMLDKACRLDFKSEAYEMMTYGAQAIGFSMLSIVTAGLLPLGYTIYSAAKEKENLSSRWAFNHAVKTLEKATNALPESEEKTLCRDFAKTAKFAYEMEQAARAHEKSLVKKNAGKYIKKGFKHIDAAAHRGLSEGKTQKLKSEFRNAKIKRSDYLRQTRDARDTCTDRLSSRQYDIKHMAV